MPPDRNMPSGTSATMRRRTASASRDSSISSASASDTSSSEAWPRAATSDSDQYVCVPDFAVFAAFEQRPGRELLDPPIDAHRRRHIAVTQERRQSVGIDLALPAGHSLERLQLRGEDETAIGVAPIERLDAEAIARKRERMGGAIPRSECEHADQALDGRPHAPDGKALDHHLGVGMPAKLTPRRLELGAELGRVVDLAVVAQHEPAAARDHRLRAGGT